MLFRLSLGALRAPFSIAFSVLALLALLNLVGCGTQKAHDASPGALPSSEQDAPSTPSAILTDAQPVSADQVKLWVYGMSCPKCVSNVDLQLRRLPGVDAVAINMGLGLVTVSMSGASRPSPQQLAGAVDDAALTLLKIEEGR
jgi:copper chaperone CopZ